MIGSCARTPLKQMLEKHLYMAFASPVGAFSERFPIYRYVLPITNMSVLKILAIPNILFATYRIGAIWLLLVSIGPLMHGRSLANKLFQETFLSRNTEAFIDKSFEWDDVWNLKRLKEMGTPALIGIGRVLQKLRRFYLLKSEIRQL